MQKEGRRKINSQLENKRGLTGANWESGNKAHGKRLWEAE